MVLVCSCALPVCSVVVPAYFSWLVLVLPCSGAFHHLVVVVIPIIAVVVVGRAGVPGARAGAPLPHQASPENQDH